MCPFIRRNNDNIESCSDTRKIIEAKKMENFCRYCFILIKIKAKDMLECIALGFIWDDSDF
jgi:hypothetical protein